MNINCSAEPCPVILDATCVFYTGGNLLYTGIVTNDNLQTALQKIDAKFQDAAIEYYTGNLDIPASIVQQWGVSDDIIWNYVTTTLGIIII
jgi:hypothetical protein